MSKGACGEKDGSATLFFDNYTCVRRKKEQQTKTDSTFTGLLEEINQFARNNYSTKMKENSGADLNEPSEYELLRQRNIEKRKSLFQELNLNQVGNVVIYFGCLVCSINDANEYYMVMTNPFLSYFS